VATFNFVPIPYPGVPNTFVPIGSISYDPVHNLVYGGELDAPDIWPLNPTTGAISSPIVLSGSGSPSNVAVNSGYTLATIFGNQFAIYNLGTNAEIDNGSLGSVQPLEFTPAQANLQADGWALTTQGNPGTDTYIIGGSTQASLGSDVIVRDDRSLLYGLSPGSGMLTSATYTANSVVISKTYPSAFGAAATAIYYSNGYVIADTGEEYDPVAGEPVGLLTSGSPGQLFVTVPSSDRVYSFTTDPEIVVYNRTTPVPVEVVPVPDSMGDPLPMIYNQHGVIWCGSGMLAYPAEIPRPKLPPIFGIMFVSGLPQ
jgi:hypothetical protein